MATTQIARPYARAAFEHACGGDALAAWSDALALLAAVAADASAAAVIADPRLPRTRRGELLLEVCGDRIDAGVGNLVRLLAVNGRLPLIGEVAAQYERLRAEAENRIDARVTTASPLSDEQQARLARALSSRLGGEVHLEPVVDEQIIGGVIVRAGDRVIDASLRGRLARLANRIAH